MIAVEEAVGKLRSLSPDRSQRVLALIEDLAELQALEDKQDIEDARTSWPSPVRTSLCSSWPRNYVLM